MPSAALWRFVAVRHVGGACERAKFSVRSGDAARDAAAARLAARPDDGSSSRRQGHGRHVVPQRGGELARERQRGQIRFRVGEARELHAGTDRARPEDGQGSVGGHPLAPEERHRRVRRPARRSASGSRRISFTPDCARLAGSAAYFLCNCPETALQSGVTRPGARGSQWPMACFSVRQVNQWECVHATAGIRENRSDRGHRRRCGTGSGSGANHLQLENDELLRAERGVLLDRPGQREGPHQPHRGDVQRAYEDPVLSAPAS